MTHFNLYLSSLSLNLGKNERRIGHLKKKFKVTSEKFRGQDFYQIEPAFKTAAALFNLEEFLDVALNHFNLGEIIEETKDWTIRTKYIPLREVVTKTAQEEANTQPDSNCIFLQEVLEFNLMSLNFKFDLTL